MFARLREVRMFRLTMKELYLDTKETISSKLSCDCLIVDIQRTLLNNLLNILKEPVMVFALIDKLLFYHRCMKVSETIMRFETLCQEGLLQGYRQRLGLQ